MIYHLTGHLHEHLGTSTTLGARGEVFYVFCGVREIQLTRVLAFALGELGRHVLVVQVVRTVLDTAKELVIGCDGLVGAVDFLRDHLAH
jgi:hypothetical protein